MADQPPTPPPAAQPPIDELPELTLSLRSFGSRRGSLESAAVTEEQERYFAPLLDARKRANNAKSRGQIIAAFEATHVLAQVDATLRAFAAERFTARPPARRAFEAELFEVAESFRQALQLLAERARESEVDERGGFGAWLDQLRATFRIADDSWLSMRAALDAQPSVTKRGLRWPRPGRGAR